MNDFLIRPKLRKLRPGPDEIIQIEHREIVQDGEPPRERALAPTGIAENDDPHSRALTECRNSRIKNLIDKIDETVRAER